MKATIKTNIALKVWKSKMIVWNIHAFVAKLIFLGQCIIFKTASFVHLFLFSKEGFPGVNKQNVRKVLNFCYIEGCSLCVEEMWLGLFCVFEKKNKWSVWGKFRHNFGEIFAFKQMVVCLFCALNLLVCTFV